MTLINSPRRTEWRSILKRQRTFNKSRKFDFPPEVNLPDQPNLEVIMETKLVGVIISDDLKWQKNTDYICQRARTKLWTLRRLKKLNFDLFHILDVYTKEVRSLLELAVPVWHSGLTRLQSAQIERVQKTAFHIILGDEYSGYDFACILLWMETLEQRRLRLCIKFTNTWAKPSKVKEIICRTNCFRKSALPYLSSLLNSTWQHLRTFKRVISVFHGN